jgi:hypothetical protein
VETGSLEHTVCGHGHRGHRGESDRDLDRLLAQEDEDGYELFFV